jgi:hypothetical protein
MESPRTGDLVIQKLPKIMGPDQTLILNPNFKPSLSMILSPLGTIFFFFSFFFFPFRKGKKKKEKKKKKERWWWATPTTPTYLPHF